MCVRACVLVAHVFFWLLSWAGAVACVRFLITSVKHREEGSEQEQESSDDDADEAGGAPKSKRAKAKSKKTPVASPVKKPVARIAGYGSQQSPSIAKIRAQRELGDSGQRQRRKWTADEIDALAEGLCKYGVGAWAPISFEYGDRFQQRTAVDLKVSFVACVMCDVCDGMCGFEM